MSRRLLSPEQLGPRLPLLAMSVAFVIGSILAGAMGSAGGAVVMLALAYVCAAAAKQR